MNRHMRIDRRNWQGCRLPGEHPDRGAGRLAGTIRAYVSLDGNLAVNHSRSRPMTLVGQSS
jgi:hypothetical protein